VIIFSAEGGLLAEGSVEYFVRFVRLRLLGNGAITPIRFLPAGLDRLKCEEHELSMNKLTVLAEIYNLPPEQLLRSVYPARRAARAP
jgi:hypothetical protein